MYCRTIALLLIIVFVESAAAREVDIGKIKKVVQTKTGEFNKKSRGGYSILQEPRSYFDGVDRLAYIQPLAPRGFIAIAADDNLEPIMGYSLTHDFVWDDDPDNLLYHLVKSDLILRRDLAKRQNASEKNRIAKKWDRLMVDTAEAGEEAQTVWPPAGSTSTGGWVTTLWHQDQPFNACCPYDNVNNGRSIVGCVATAMAQIVNYFGHPADVADFSDADDYTSSYNNFTFHIDNDCGTNGTLKWPALNAALSAITYPVADGSAAGLADELCYACGISVNMEYSADASAAATSQVANALKTRFGYASADYKTPSAADFFPLLTSNMKDAQPAQMSIRRADNVGHSIVVDGFDEVGEGSDDDLYHLNYGWGSASFCYWWNLLPYNNVDPPLPQNFVLISGAVVNISPVLGILGEINGDSAVNSTDALIVLSGDAGINVTQFCPMNCGDVNSDGWVNSTDALIILSLDAGLSVPFPVGQSGCPASVTPCPGCEP